MKLKYLVSCALLVGSLVGFANAQSNDTIRFATNSEFPPMEFIENGKQTGFDIDIALALGNAMKKKIEFTEIAFKGLIPGIISNRFDASISAIYITPDKEKVVAFTAPYFSGGLVIFSKSDSKLNSTSDVDGKSIAVVAGTKGAYFMKESHPKVNLIEVQTQQEMIELVASGRVEGAITGKPAALYLAKTRRQFRVLTGQLTTEAYGIAVNKAQPDLVKSLNEALAKIRADGTYEKIEQKWFGMAK